MKKYIKSTISTDNVIYNSWASFIGGGDFNNIWPPQGSYVFRSFIGGGNANWICDSLSSIVGGQANIINQGAPHSFIGGGNGNVVSGPCSAILGGNGNNDGGLANVHIVGSGITAASPNTVHVNGLWANGLPTYAGGPPIAPAGTVFILAPGTPAPAWAQGQLWIA